MKPDQKGRDCVLRICLEQQEAPITKRFDFSLHRLELGISGVYFRLFPSSPVLRQNNRRKTSFHHFQLTSQCRQLLVGSNYIQGQTRSRAVAALLES